MKEKGGELLAVSSAETSDLRSLAEDEKLSFSLLSDPGCIAIGAWGLLHEHAGPHGSNIAVPAQFLLRKDGTILWRHVSARISDRASPEDALAAIAEL